MGGIWVPHQRPTRWPLRTAPPPRPPPALGARPVTVQPPPVTGRRERVIALAVIAALLLLAAGLRAATIADRGPGLVPRTWPAGSRLTRPAPPPTALLFVAAAPVDDAARAVDALLALRASAPEARVVVVFEGVPPRPIWDLAAAPGVERAVDDGAEATRFGARYSGQAVVYDRTGALRYAGPVGAAAARRGLATARAGGPGPALRVAGSGRALR